MIPNCKNLFNKSYPRGCKIQKRVSPVGSVRYQIAITIPVAIRAEFGGKDRLYFRSASYTEVVEKKKEFEDRINEVCKRYAKWDSVTDSDLWAIMRRWKNVSPEAR